MERVIKIFPIHKILAESLALDLINMIKENKDSNFLSQLHFQAGIHRAFCFRYWVISTEMRSTGIMFIFSGLMKDAYLLIIKKATSG